jgi:hypothetical protein
LSRKVEHFILFEIIGWIQDDGNGFSRV